jgi:IS4 transposase
MLLDSLFKPFLAKRPICVMARGVLTHMLEPFRLDQLFRDTAQRQYQKDLLFSSLAALMADVVLRVQPTVHAAYQSGCYGITVSPTALYNKLDRVETGISAELVRDSARQASPVIEALDAALPPWLPGYHCRILDGTHLAATEHRLEELRYTWEAPLPGTALVVFDPEQALAVDAFLTEDGHAQERSLLDQVIATIRARDLWIADRNFCTLRFLAAIAERFGFFVIRQHGTVKGELIGKRKRITRTTTGVVFEQPIRLANPVTGGSWILRRVTVELKQPTRDGDQEIHLLTNLPAKVGAGEVSELYRKRWTIETVFAEITKTLACEIDTLAYPKAALLAFCLALLAYNAVSVLKASLRAVHGEKKVAQISAYYLALEIQQAYDGMMVAIPVEHWQPLQQCSAKEMASWLRRVAQGINLSRYRKHPRGPKKKPPKKAAYRNGRHVSTAQLLSERRPC